MPRWSEFPLVTSPQHQIGPLNAYKRWSKNRELFFSSDNIQVPNLPLLQPSFYPVYQSVEVDHATIMLTLIWTPGQGLQHYLIVTPDDPARKFSLELFLVRA